MKKMLVTLVVVMFFAVFAEVGLAEKNNSWIPGVKKTETLTDTKKALLRFSVENIETVPEGILIAFSMPAFIFDGGERFPPEHYTWKISGAWSDKYQNEGWNPAQDLHIVVSDEGKAKDGMIHGHFIVSQGIYRIRIGVPCDTICSSVNKGDPFAREDIKEVVSYEFLVNTKDEQWTFVPSEYPPFPWGGL